MMKATDFEPKQFTGTNPLRIRMPEFSLNWAWRMLKSLIVVPLLRRFLDFLRPQIEELVDWVYNERNRSAVEEAVDEWLSDIERRIETEL